MPRLAVILDTNAYRGITDAAFDAMVADERSHSVIAMASYIVVSELLAHLADEHDPDFKACLRAVARLGRHCSRWRGGAEVDFMQLADAQVVRQLFGQSIASEVRPGGYATIIGEVSRNPVAEVVRGYHEELTLVRDGIMKAEAEFVANLWKKVVLTLDPAASTWQAVIRSPKRTTLLQAITAGEGLDLVAGTIVDRAASKAGVSLTEAQRMEAIKRAHRSFPTAIHHHNLLIRRLLENGPDMSKPERANSVWDHELTFSTAPGATVVGAPLVLVTGDPLILQASSDAGTRAHVWSFDEYRARVGNSDALIDTYLS